MSRIEFSHHSRALGYRTTFTAVVPSIDWLEMKGGKTAEAFYGRRFPVLWLLHGSSGDNDCWSRFTRLESWAEQYRVAVIMPDARLSAYSDMEKGPAHYTYITEELPELCRSLFPLHDGRENNFIGGLSMGGYGALKIGLRNPERYGLILNLSGGVDRVAHVERTISEGRETGLHNLTAMRATFGDLSTVRGSVHDVFALAENLGRSDRPRPGIFTAIGTDDLHWEENLRLQRLLTESGFDAHWEEGPFIHDWTCWNHYIERALQWTVEQRTTGGDAIEAWVSPTIALQGRR